MLIPVTRCTEVSRASLELVLIRCLGSMTNGIESEWTKSCPTLIPWETIIGWYLQGNSIIPGF